MRLRWLNGDFGRTERAWGRWSILLAVCPLLMLSACTSSCPSKDAAKATVEKVMPVKFEVASVKRMEGIPGLCETVVLANKQPIVLYLDAKGRYIVSGSVIEIATRKNLTLEKQKEYKK